MDINVFIHPSSQEDSATAELRRISRALERIAVILKIGFEQGDDRAAIREQIGKLDKNTESLKKAVDANTPK